LPDPTHHQVAELSGVSHSLAVVRREVVADGAGEQRQFLGLPEAERGGGAAGAGDVGAGVPEEHAIRGHAADTGRCGAARVQVLDAGAAKAAVKEAAFRWRTGEPNLTDLAWPGVDLLSRMLLASSSRFMMIHLISCEIDQDFCVLLVGCSYV